MDKIKIQLRIVWKLINTKNLNLALNIHNQIQIQTTITSMDET